MAEYTARDLHRWADKIGQSIDAVVAAVCLQMSASIIMRTPVDTGRARGNWQASIGSPATGLSSGMDARTVLSEAEAVAQMAPGSVFFLTNNLPYIRRLEYGHSSQAPHGMVRVTASEFGSAIRKQLRG